MMKVFVLLLVGVSVTSAFAPGPAPAETLSNGIEMPRVWPPQLSVLPDALPTPPYLVSPPAVIPIDVGRQLFIDDFLIQETTLARRFHRPVYHPANPVLAPDRAWEQGDGAPMAMPYSGGVWFDPADRKFKAWYMAGYTRHLCYAESRDGVVWDKPALDVVKGTNIVLPNGATESNTLWPDPLEKDPKRRYKFFNQRGGAIGNLVYRASPDGIHGWTGELWQSGRCGDRTTVFYNPFRARWVINVRESYPPGQRGRARRYWEVDDINDPAAVAWPAQNKVPLWVTADRGLDAPNTEVGFAPQLYHLDCIAYESVMLGLFTILRGYFHADGSEGRLVYPGRPKHNDVCVGFSRDGFHWQRPDHRPFLPLSNHKGDWNWGNIQSVGGGVHVVGDYLYIYCSGRAGEAHGKGNKLRFDADGSMGLAVLRRDGFASMEAGAAEGRLTTRSLRFGGKHLFVNADASAGELRVEVVDAAGRVVAPFTKENCIPLRSNATLQRVAWKGAADLAKIAGTEVRFRFWLTKGSLFAFWVSPEASGASHGHVGAGGPGFTSLRDTVGATADAGNRPPLAKSTVDDGGVRNTALPRKDSVPPRDRLVLWLKADALTGVKDGAPLAVWPDAAKNGLDPFQSDPAKRPVWKQAAVNGLPAVRFDGVDDHLRTSYYRDLLSTSHKVSVFAVFKPSGSVGPRGLVSSNLTALCTTPDRAGSLAYTTAYQTAEGKNVWTNVNSSQPGAVRPDRWAIGAVIRSGKETGQTHLLVNGVRNDDGTAIPYHAMNAERGFVGCLRGETGCWKGDIAEVLIYSEALAEENQRACAALPEPKVWPGQQVKRMSPFSLRPVVAADRLPLSSRGAEPADRAGIKTQKERRAARRQPTGAAGATVFTGGLTPRRSPFFLRSVWFSEVSRLSNPPSVELCRSETRAGR